MIGGNSFQTVTLRRDPETIAVTAPIGSSGVFEMDTQSDMYLPFEGHGVDGMWEFQSAPGLESYRFPDAIECADYLRLSRAPELRLRTAGNTGTEAVRAIGSGLQLRQRLPGCMVRLAQLQSAGRGGAHDRSSAHHSRRLPVELGQHPHATGCALLLACRWHKARKSP